MATLPPEPILPRSPVLDPAAPEVLAEALVAPVEPIEWTEADELAASPPISPGSDSESAIRH